MSYLATKINRFSAKWTSCLCKMPFEKFIATLSRQAPVLIAGPTASGKSALAMALAARDGRVIVNADSLQVYANWRLLTARPSLEDEKTAPHALYGHLGRAETYSVGAWLRAVTGYLDRPVVIVGGTGLYFSALTEGLADIPPTPDTIRKQADQRLLDIGLTGLLAELDHDSKSRIDQNNPARVQRAWEVLQTTGKGIAYWQDQTGPALLPLSNTQAVVLVPDVEPLNQRISLRFHQMLEQGLLDELSQERPFWDPRHPASKAIGAAELMAYLQGLDDLSTAVDKAILASRQYAKRQRTWFRSRMKQWRTCDPFGE